MVLEWFPPRASMTAWDARKKGISLEEWQSWPFVGYNDNGDECRQPPTKEEQDEDVA